MQSQSRGILQQGHGSRAGMQLQLRFSCWTQMSWSSLHPLPSQGFHSKNFSLRTIKSIPKMSFHSCPISACWTQISQLSLAPPHPNVLNPKISLLEEQKVSQSLLLTPAPLLLLEPNFLTFFRPPTHPNLFIPKIPLLKPPEVSSLIPKNRWETEFQRSPTGSCCPLLLTLRNIWDYHY